MKYDVIGFARAELEGHLDLMGIKSELALSLFEDMGIVEPSVSDKKYDDAIEISIKDGRGYIAASNERSVLIGVYRLLYEWGVRFVRPGRGGTYIPKDCRARDLYIHEVASCRHRTVCIEGAVSIENVLDMIDWLPKLGFNGYYIQFDDAFIFFDRWYSHRNNPLRSPEPFDYDKAREYVDAMTREIKRRGLILERMGHGWTSDPFGIKNHGWDPVDPATIPDSYRELCALVGGKRDVWLDKPLATQLCYSNSLVRETMVQGVIDYVKKNPETDVIHFWLGDYYNNTCECENCTRLYYSDYCVRLLNDVTDGLKKQGIDKKVVFPIGYNQAYPPKIERVRNTENTVMMFAPISRTFALSYPRGFKITEAPEYKVNSFDLPTSVDENLAYLSAWERCYDGDTVDFDYHLMWDHLLDAGGEGIARVIHEDVKNFESLGINGLISCQLQRNVFPTSIAMTAMAKTLWNTETDFDSLRRELYSASFGEEYADELCEYFSVLSRGFYIGALRSQVEVDKKEFKRNMESACLAMENIKGLIEQGLTASDPTQRRSFELLSSHREIYSTLAQGILNYLNGDEGALYRARDASTLRAWELETATQDAFDTMFYGNVLKYRINLEGAVAFFDF